MTEAEMTQIMALLAEANPKTIFLEVAFLESWTSAMRKHRGVVPVHMLQRSLPFFEREFRWVPRPVFAPKTRPAWALRAASLGAMLLAFLQPATTTG